MSVITREIINKNIIFRDKTVDVNIHKEYTYKDLSKEIDRLKNLLQSFGVKKGNTILIGIDPSIYQTACIFACFELALTIVVDDSKIDTSNLDKIDPTLKPLLPINFFITNASDYEDKHQYYKKYCDNVIDLKLIRNISYEKNQKIDCNEQDIVLKCLDTNRNGKFTQHTQKFFYQLIERNSVFFDKNVGLLMNLNHGSSMATYFLPAITSSKVEMIINNTDNPYLIDKLCQNEKIDHLMLPYSNMLNRLSKNTKNTNFYLLGSIPDFLLTKKFKKTYKNVFSFFGNNNVSGPILINSIKNKNYQPTSYFKVDNFYELNLDDNGRLSVYNPIYDQTFNSNDYFTCDNGIYYFKGKYIEEDNNNQ